MNIIFDLDGTLIDASNRLYYLFQKLVPQSTLTKAEYWNRKRNKIGHEQILREEFPELSFEYFNSKWMNLIETDEYLEMDCCYTDTIDTLKILNQKCSIFLLTARQNKEKLLNELRRLSLLPYFKKIFVTQNRKSKDELLKEILESKEIRFSNEDLFVSDMGRDIEIGNKYGFYTIAITHGFMSKEKLQEYNPKCCMDKLFELINYITM